MAPLAHPEWIAPAQVIFTLAHVVWALRVRTVATWGRALQGEITRLARPESVQQPGLELEYSYEAGGRKQQGSTTLADTKLAERHGAGGRVWLVVHPQDASRSIPWL